MNPLALDSKKPSSVAIRSPRRRAAVSLLLTLLAMLAVWAPRQAELSQARRAVAQAKTEAAGLEERLAAATAALEEARSESYRQNTRHDQARAAVARAEADLARVDPDQPWVAPPAVWPEWNEDSPYVWLRKESLPRLPVEVFASDGGLRPEVAAVLTLSDQQHRALNAALSGLVAEYRTLEVAHAERIDEHLPGIKGDGPKATVRVNPLPEAGARLRERFEATLHGELGEQRASLLTRAAAGWLDGHFSRVGAEPKLISVIRHADGSYNISVKSGNLSLSVGGMTSIEDYVPLHLQPLFAEVMDRTGLRGLSEANGKP